MKLQHVICLMAAMGLTACVNTKHLEQEATVSRQQAEAIALQQVPNGSIKETELEKEKGKVIWSVEVLQPDTKKKTEVEIDAKTGAVLEVESKHHD